MGFRPLHVFPLSSVPLYTHYLSFFVSCLSVFMSWHPILSLSLSRARTSVVPGHLASFISTAYTRSVLSSFHILICLFVLRLFLWEACCLAGGGDRVCGITANEGVHILW